MDSHDKRLNTFQICLWSDKPQTKGDEKMKKSIIALFALVAFAGTAFASGPESITLKASKGDITFPHKKHQEIVKNDCKKCHENAAGGKIGKMGMKKGHDACVVCHKEKGKGACDVCHKK